MVPRVSSRGLDVVVFGASGVTGRNVAAHLAERARDQPLSWAAAGRDAAKVERVLEEIGVSAPEVISADVDDPLSLERMAERTRVVLNLVGPYTLYGRPVIEACVHAGTHYADLTGEMPFVRRIIDEFDAPAREAGVKIVQVCGFEALPADLAVMLAAEAARERFDEPLASVDLEVAVDPRPGLPHASDVLSGGTIQSMFAIARTQDAELALDPAALIEDEGAAVSVRHVSPILVMPRLGGDGAVIAPMSPAAFINPAVIHRSAYLAALSDGRPPQPFRYREGVLMRGGPVTLPFRLAAAGALSSMQVGLRGITRARADRRRRVAGALARLAPSSGFGPTGDRLEGWHWSIRVSARTLGERTVSVRVDADGHPGYLATARMIGEAGLLLAEGSSATRDVSGCLTPAIALGTASAPRFEHARVRFSVDP
jgi:short subunit dehydrogenase-like uncharacterized protein